MPNVELTQHEIESLRTLLLEIIRADLQGNQYCRIRLRPERAYVRSDFVTDLMLIEAKINSKQGKHNEKTAARS